MNPTKHRCELGCSRRVSSSCSTSGTRRVNIVANAVISREGLKPRYIFWRVCTSCKIWKWAVMHTRVRGIDLFCFYSRFWNCFNNVVFLAKIRHIRTSIAIWLNQHVNDNILQKDCKWLFLSLCFQSHPMSSKIFPNYVVCLLS